MSLSRLPRRIAILGAATAMLALGAPAWGETVRSNQIGGSRALLQCSEATAAGDFSDEALGRCDLALRDNLVPEQRFAVLVNRGVMRVRRQEHALAMADFDAALEIAPDNAVALFNRGLAQVRLRQDGPAVATLTRALSLGVESPYLAYYFRGVARERLGDSRGALEDYSTALEINPDWAPAEEDMARFARARREALTAELDQGGAPAP